jgi:hypothetical protein
MVCHSNPLGENYSLVLSMKHFIAAIAIALGLAGQASAQSNLDVQQKNIASVSITHEFASRVMDATPGAIAVQKVEAEKTVAIAKASQRSLMADSMQVATEKLVSDHAAGSTELLRSGSVLELATTMGGIHSAMEQHSINVHVTYDARPVGGILNIRVELVPVFGGIGSAVRPTISREFAQAVENFDDDFISETIMKLTNDLATELASNQ